MNINVKYYKENEVELSNVEKDICTYIKENEKSQYNNMIYKDGRLKVLQSLSNIRSNIINWYPFNKTSSILEINANFGELTQELCTKLNKVTVIEESKEKAEAIEKRLEDAENLEIIVGNIQDIVLQNKFDYILINGLEEHQTFLEEYLEFSKKYINDNGTILFTTDNKFGLKTYNTNCANMQQKKYITKYKIEEILNNYNLKNYKFYYPLPNYKTPNVIFTDKHKPSNESILRDLTLYDENEIIVFDERNRYKEIIRENSQLFDFFANSYLVEISNVDNKIEFISFGNSRKEKYRMKTVMLEEQVYKQNITEEGKKHIEQIKNNIQILVNSGINVLDHFQDEKIYSRLIREEKSLDKVLIQKFEEGKKQEFIEILEKFIKEINENLEKSDGTTEDVFEKYRIKIDKELKGELNYIKYGIYDLIFQNCFFINDKFYFYDQEWMENNMPIEFILYRAINYLANSKSEIDREILYNRFELTPYISVFEKLENALQDNIKDIFIWKMHASNNTTVKNLYDTKVHYQNLKAQAERKIIEEQEIRNNEIKLRDEKIDNLTKELNYVKNSRSWKMTKVFREFKKRMNSERKGMEDGTEKEN